MNDKDKSKQHSLLKSLLVALAIVCAVGFAGRLTLDKCGIRTEPVVVEKPTKGEVISAVKVIIGIWVLLSNEDESSQPPRT